MTIFESSLSAKHFGLHLELPVLQELGRVLIVVLGIYAILRVEDLANRGVFRLVFQPGYQTYLFWVEITLGLILPSPCCCSGAYVTTRKDSTGRPSRSSWASSQIA